MGLSRKLTNTHKEKFSICGSIMVDAAISLTAFVIAVGMLLEVINIVSKEEYAYYNAECKIQTIALASSRLDIGVTIDKPDDGLYIDHVQFYPIIKNIKIPFAGAFFNNVIESMDMPYRCYIGESPDPYSDVYVYIFPKNEGNEKGDSKYHTTYCRTMKGGATKGLEIEKVTESDAKSRGYTKCLWCIKEEKGQAD